MHLMQCVITMSGPTTATVRKDLLEMATDAVSVGMSSAST